VLMQRDLNAELAKISGTYRQRWSDGGTLVLKQLDAVGRL
jgi:hypothetical protein